MIHNRVGRKLKRTASHRKALLGNMATSLFQHKRIVTTEAKAKELRRFAEPLITRAKQALMNEKSGNLVAGQKVDIHNRRIVGRTVHNKGVLQELFDTIAPSVEHRNGGYLRIIKLGQRRGDAGRMASIELVDFFDTVQPAKKKKKTVARPAAPVAAKPSSDVIAPVAAPAPVAMAEEAPMAVAAVEETPVVAAEASAESLPVETASETAESAPEQSDEQSDEKPEQA